MFIGSSIWNRCKAVRGVLAIAALASLTGCANFEVGWEAYQQGDFAAALEEWEPLAESGDARAQFNLGIMYEQGKGVAQNIERAVDLWQQSAEQSYARAQHNLATNYLAGDGVEQDVDQALKWFTAAADQGFARSRRNNF